MGVPVAPVWYTAAMETKQLLAQLRQERDKLNAAIAALEGLDGTPARKGQAKPGRPTGKVGVGTKPAKRTVSPAARKKMAAAAKARWAKRKADEKKKVKGA